MPSVARSALAKLFKVVSLLLLALWLPATLHCSLETVGWQSDCHAEVTTEAADAACHADPCEVVEGDSYVKSSGVLRAPQPLGVDAHAGLLLLALWIRPGASEPVEIVRSVEHPELIGLQRSWSFERREALPARAPDRVV